jgi:hypothetical protein
VPNYHCQEPDDDHAHQCQTLRRRAVCGMSRAGSALTGRPRRQSAAGFQDPRSPGQTSTQDHPDAMSRIVDPTLTHRWYPMPERPQNSRSEASRHARRPHRADRRRADVALSVWAPVDN